MSKIDLHVHTIGIKKGENKRNIEPEKLLEKFAANDVKIAAITNHNFFDEKQFDEIIKIQKDDSDSQNSLIFPGVEVDIRNNDSSYQIIVIMNPDDKSKLINFYAKNKDDAKEFNIEFNDFIKKIKKINKNNILIIPHFDKENGITEEMRNQLKEDLDEYNIILEPSSLKSMSILISNDMNSLVGSDVLDWDKYPQKNLPDIYFLPDNWRLFSSLCRDPYSFINRFIDEAEKYNIEYHVDAEEYNIQIFKGINVIFGAKGSGKSCLLKEIKNFFNKLGFEISYINGNKSQEEYEKIINTNENRVKLDNGEFEILKNKLDTLIQIKEKPVKNPIKDYRNHFKFDNKKFLEKFKYSKMDYPQSPSNFNFENNNKYLNKVMDEINDVIDFNNDLEFVELRDKNLIVEQLIKLKIDSKISFLNSYKDNFKDANVINFIRSLKDSGKKQKNVDPIPALGWDKFTESRLDFMIKIKEILVILRELDLKKENFTLLSNLPEKGELVQNVNNVFIDFKNDGKKINTEIFQKLLNFDISKLKNGGINSIFDSNVEKNKLLKEDITKIVKLQSKITINDSDGNQREYEPSTGEQSMVSIVDKLDNQYDVYILDEIENGLGGMYIKEKILPQIKNLRDLKKIVVMVTHDGNLGVNSVPIQSILAKYKDDFYQGNLFTNKLIGSKTREEVTWSEKAVSHFEGGTELFKIRGDKYGI